MKLDVDLCLVIIFKSLEILWNILLFSMWCIFSKVNILKMNMIYWELNLNFYFNRLKVVYRDE